MKRIVMYVCIVLLMSTSMCYSLPGLSAVNRYNDLVERDWKGIVVHHTASPAWTTVEKIDQWHKERGWDGIGYHYVIYVDGSVHEGRSLSKVGAHAKGRNATHIGIALVGYDSFTPAQITALEGLVDKLGLPAERHHKDCPGGGVDVEGLN